MFKRILRRSIPNVKRWLYFALLLALGLFASTLLGEAGCAIGEGDAALAALCLFATWIIAALVALLIYGGSKLFGEWDLTLAEEDRRRCPDCDGPIRPGVIEQGRLICLPCARTGWATASELPVAARKAGV
jgi:hypothetical protein